MSSNIKVTPDGFEAAVKDILNDYADDVVKDVKQAVELTGKETVQFVHAAISAAGIGGRKYRNSYRVKTLKSTSFETSVVIHSPKYYRIAHLLEHGHTLKIHGRVLGTVRAFPHLAPAEAKAEQLLVRNVEKAIRG